LKIKAEERGLLDNTWNDVYQMFKSGDVSAARAAATERGLAFDPANPKSIAEMEMRAKRSPDYKAAQEEARKAAKEGREVSEEDRKRLGVGTGKDVPAGVREVVSDGQVYFVDANGKKLTQEQINAMNERKARAGASTTVIGGGSSGKAPVAGEISAILRDKLGNEKLDPQVAKSLQASQNAAKNAGSILREIPDIEKILPATSQSGVGAAIGRAQTFVGVGDIGAANKKMEQFANRALGVLDSPLMKGAPSEADARRALSQINDPEAPLDVKQAAVASLKASMEEAIRFHSDSVGQYDAKTRERLKGVGVQGPAEPTKPAPTTATITPAEFDAKWAKLPKGGQLVGPDGKTYTKR
jgi:hypothetical protein